VRGLADAERIEKFMRALGRAATGEARVYFTGGATAVLNGWRPSTIDVDIRVVPEQDAIFRAIQELKEQLQINVELASPDHFIPVKPGWEERSPFIARNGQISFHHFDLYAQALSKIERGHAQDADDVRQLLRSGLVTREALLAYFAAIEPHLYRYPAVDPVAFRRAVEAAVR
jgi:uncharacterized nucleotidyltransferase DUF6036